MRRVTSRGDGIEHDSARGIAEKDGSEMRRAVRKMKPEPDDGEMPDSSVMRKRRRRLERMRERHNTTAVKAQIVAHMRSVLALKEENPSAFAQAQEELSASPKTNVPDVDVEEFFSSWVQLDYDRHMRETGHDRAVEILLRQLVEINALNAQTDGHPIFGNRLLEMGCGTGTPIMLLSQLLPREDFSNISITANDITKDMIREARKKLRGMPNIRFTNQDICECPAFGDMFDTVILSQTLPFIAAKWLLELENRQRIENSEHVQKKLEVIEEIFRRNLNANGYFVLIDEWPMKLTESTRDPRKELERQLAALAGGSVDLREELEKKRVIEEQFLRIFRPIRERNTLYNKIFRNNEFGARFVAELKARIDREHSMYLMIYRKDPDKLLHRGRLLPSTKEGAEREGISLADADDARESAAERLLMLVKATDRHFTAHFKPINGEREIWAELMPIDSGPIQHSRDGSLNGETPHNTIVLDRELHNMDSETRKQRLDDAVANLRDGGALVVIDEWDAPETVPYRISKSDWRDKVMVPHRDRLVFEASFRVPIMAGYDSGMYGYVYRKRY